MNISDVASQIQTYYGKEGVAHITRNSLEAKNHLYIYETSYASLNDIFGYDEAEIVRKDFISRKIKVFELTNQHFHEKYTKQVEFHEKVMNIRCISPQIFKIELETLIYNNVVAFYTLDEPVYGVEIVNQHFANEQIKLFKILWQQGDLPIIGKGGKTSVI